MVKSSRIGRARRRLSPIRVAGRQTPAPPPGPVPPAPTLVAPRSVGLRSPHEQAGAAAARAARGATRAGRAAPETGGAPAAAACVPGVGGRPRAGRAPHAERVRERRPAGRGPRRQVLRPERVPSRRAVGREPLPGGRLGRRRRAGGTVSPAPPAHLRRGPGALRTGSPRLPRDQHRRAPAGDPRTLLDPRDAARTSGTAPGRHDTGTTDDD